MLPSSDIQINVLSAEHCKVMADLHQKCFNKYWAYDVFEKFIKQTDKYFFGAFYNQTLIGLSEIMLVAPEAEILTLCTHPLYRRTKIATILCDEVFKYCLKHNIEVIHLEVQCSNTAAITLYKNYGFLISGLRKDYYENENKSFEDAVLMKLFL